MYTNDETSFILQATSRRCQYLNCTAHRHNGRTTAELKTIRNNTVAAYLDTTSEFTYRCREIQTERLLNTRLCWRGPAAIYWTGCCKWLRATKSECDYKIKLEADDNTVFFFSFFFFSFSGWGETESTWYVGHCWPIVPAPNDRWLWSNWWNEDWQGKPKYSEKTCPSATFSTTTNPTWPDLGSNPGRRGGKPATNRLTYGTATLSLLLHEQMEGAYLCKVHVWFQATEFEELQFNTNSLQHQPHTRNNIGLFACKISVMSRKRALVLTIHKMLQWDDYTQH
jgi:hypothetical protein